MYRVESTGKLIMTSIYISLHKRGELENDLNFVLKYWDKECIKHWRCLIRGWWFKEVCVHMWTVRWEQGEVDGESEEEKNGNNWERGQRDLNGRRIRWPEGEMKLSQWCGSHTAEWLNVPVLRSGWCGFIYFLLF